MGGPADTGAAMAPQGAPEPLLRVTQLCKSYRMGGETTHILRGVELQLHAGEALALTGESGSGKSTLLHIIAGLDLPDRGHVHISGREICGLSDAERALLRRHSVGLVFQQFNLVPSLTIAENIALHARLAGRYDGALCDALAARMGLDAHLRKYPEHLSGGQQQRAAIARTLAARPALVLADEPTGNLDEQTAGAVLDLMRAALRGGQSSLLMVTHSLAMAERLDRRVHLSAGRITEPPR